MMSELRTPLIRKQQGSGSWQEVEYESWGQPVPFIGSLVDQEAPVTYRKDDQDGLRSTNRAPPVKGGDR